MQVFEHSVDFVRVDTVKDHLKSKKHNARKESKINRKAALLQADSDTC